MNAGRELDALVAEKVMGWSIVRANDELPYIETSFPVLLARRSFWEIIEDG